MNKEPTQSRFVEPPVTFRDIVDWELIGKLILTMGIIFVFLGIPLIPMANSYHCEYRDGTSMTVQLPEDCDEVISTQRDLFEYHVTYKTLGKEIKTSRYWSIMFWVRDIVWIEYTEPEITEDEHWLIQQIKNRY